MKIARVFPTKTKFSPKGEDVYFGLPMWFMPQYDEIHISCVFTWDIQRAKQLKIEWERYGKVKLGGPAFDDPGEDFVPGKYIKTGVTITSRGCPNNCSFCLVPKREGKLRELPICEGNIVQDNNLLACSDRHLDLVWSMLKKQKRIELKGGLEASRITLKIANTLRGLRIKTLWLACDSKNGIKPLQKAVEVLQKAGFNRNHLFCYVLCGKDMAEEENRLRQVYSIGCLPFAQLYRDKKDSIKYSKKQKHFQRTWSRPAAFKSLIKNKYKCSPSAVKKHK